MDMDTRMVAHEMRLGHWANILRERRESGLSIRRWCRENGCNEKTYYYWQRKLREVTCDELTRRQEAAMVNVPSFAEVSHAKEALQSGMITIRLGEIVVEISGDTAPEIVETVLRTLRSPC